MHDFLWESSFLTEHAFGEPLKIFARDSCSSRADYQSLLKGLNFQDLKKKLIAKILIVSLIDNFGVWTRTARF